MVRASAQGPLWVIGWREWIALPALGIAEIKVKIDTGARSSALHAYELERFRRGGKDFVRFVVHPYQRDRVRTVQAEAELADVRKVKSSTGQVQNRPVIRTSARLLDRVWEFDLTLTNRDEMGFRMLLGREAIRGRFLVDAGHSYHAGRPPKGKRRRIT